MAAGKKTGGRKKGTPNKMTATLKDMVLSALDQSGGVSYLVEQASTSPAAFMTLLGKVLPTQLTGDAAAPLTVVSRIELVAGVNGTD